MYYMQGNLLSALYTFHHLILTMNIKGLLLRPKGRIHVSIWNNVWHIAGTQ